MKKATRLLFVLAMATLLCCILAACSGGTGAQYTPPETISGTNNSSGGDDPGYDLEKDGTPVYLSFTYLSQSPSVFKHIYIDEFNISDIEYHITYSVVTGTNAFGEPVTEYISGDGTPLTESMLTAESKELIKTPGHHMIWVEYTYNDKKLKGSFSLHLKEHADVEYVSLSFTLNGGAALFGNTSNGVATINVESGTTYTYSDFISEFFVMRQGYALQSWTGFTTDSGKNYMTISSDKSFSANWTDDTITVSFSLKLPADATATITAPVSQLVEKDNGLVSRPTLDLENVGGYNFAGWFTSDGTAWDFNNAVGSTDFTLECKWNKRVYSVTYVLMGGEFDSAAVLPEGTYTTADYSIKYYNGYHEGEEGYDPNYTQNFYTDKPFMLTFSDLTYGENLVKYTSSVLPEKTSKDSEKITVSADPVKLAAQMRKGDSEGNDYYVVEGWYTSAEYLEADLYTSTTVSGNVVLYAKWVLREQGDGTNGTLTAEQYKNYFSNFLYSWTVKADGTARIDLVRDTAVSTLIIPATLTKNGVDYPVSEVAELAGLNLKSLIKLDASAATSLTTVGRRAFASDTALRDIVGPTGNKISSVGEDAFRATAWLKNYSNEFLSDGVTANPHAGATFAVVGKVVYEYIGDIDATSINVDDSVYPELSGAVTIGSGAFKGLTDLQTLTLSDDIENICDNAFYNCTSLLTVTAGSGLKSVGSAAFTNTLYIITIPEDDTSTADVNESEFLQLGGIYYRYLARTKTATVIPSSVSIIAPDAFAGANNIETITFSNAANITEIGLDAFSDTKWITQTVGNEGDVVYVKDGFVVINHILVAYTGRATTVSVPADVITIASRAFSGFRADKVTNVVLSAGSLAEIKSEAFYGASALRSVSFTDTTVDALVTISANAFTGKNGAIVNSGLKIYFSSVPRAEISKAVVDNDPYYEWKALCTNHPEMFNSYNASSSAYDVPIVLAVTSAKLNMSVMPKAYLYDDDLHSSLSASAFYTAAWQAAGDLLTTGSGAITADSAIKNGVIIARNDGIVRTENLLVSAFSWDTDDLSVTENQKFSFSVAGGATGNVTGDTSDSYAYSVYAAIDTTTLKVCYTNDGGGKVYALPTFYNTQAVLPTDGISLVYTLKDGSSTDGSIDLGSSMVTIDGYRSTIGTRQLVITLNYYGLDTYVLDEQTYTVKKPADAKVEQYNALAIPVNSNARDSFGSVLMLVTMDDGAESLVSLSNTSKVTIISMEDALAKKVNADSVTLATDTLGYHIAGVRYGSKKDGYVFCTLLYSVVLSSDPAMFTYSITDSANKKAVVTGVGTKYDTTIAVPSKVSLDATGAYKSGGTVYDIVGIDDNSFKNKTALECVYIPASVTDIGNGAFYGCTALKWVRSFVVQDEPEEEAVGLSNVQVLSETGDYAASVTLQYIVNTKLTEIVIPESYVYTVERAGEGTDGCDLTANYTSTVKLSAGIFTSYAGKIYLPDTEYFRNYARDYMQSKTVDEDYFFYTEGKTATSASAFSIPDYDNPTVSAATVTGEVKIKSAADLDVTDNAVIIPDKFSGETDGVYKTSYTYTVVALADDAFSAVFANNGNIHVSVYMPNTLRLSDDDSDLFGTIAAEVSFYVYDATDEYIYSPANVFSATVKTIGSQAFSGCTLLEDIDFTAAEALEEIGNYAFYGCSSLTALDLSNTSLSDIDVYTFAECSNLVSIVLPSNVTEIGNGAFENCKKLASVTGYASLMYIGTDAFHNCALTEFVVSDTLEASCLSGGSFSGCASLSEVWVLSSEISAAIADNACGDLINNADVVFCVSGVTHTSSFDGKFERVTGTQGATVTVGGASVVYPESGATVTWGANNTITVTYSGATITLEVYVRQ